MQRLSRALREENFVFGSSLRDGKEYLLFDTTERVPVLRFVSLLALACPVFLSFLVLRMTEESMISDLGSVAAGRMLQAGLIILSSVYLVVMLWLSGKYVLKMIRLGDGSIQIITWRILFTDKKLIFNKTDFSPAIYSRGKVILVRAPYYVTKAGNRKLIIDEQGDFPLGEDTALEAIGSEAS